MIFFLLLPLLVAGAQVQKAGLKLPDDAAANKELVHKTFLEAYGAYKQYAFGHDDLAPKTRGAVDPRNGWGASLFDAMPTLFIMGEKELFDEAAAFAAKVDFSKSKTGAGVSFFETTIRYLGGILSAYELGNKTDAALLANAQHLGDQLATAWAGGQTVPGSNLYFGSAGSTAPPPSNLAEAGTNVIEFAKLAQFTGNETYLRLAEGAMRAIATNPSPVYPGLPPLNLDRNGKGVGATVTWGGAYDSYLEYLLKYGRLTATTRTDPLWTTTWLAAVDSSIAHLITTTSKKNLTFLTSSNGGILDYSMGDLACFAGGNWIMGGKLLGRDDIVDMGLRITDGCMATYNTASGLGPDGWAFEPANGQGSGVPPGQQQFYDDHGFWITSAGYYVRPEVFESAFYAFRATGDPKYTTFAANGIRAIRSYLNSTVGYTTLRDVNQGKWSLDNQGNDLESFFFAEVMKYLYLIFDDPAHISLDEWVFNTEAHPLRPLGEFAAPSPSSSSSPGPSNGGSSADTSGGKGNEDGGGFQIAVPVGIWILACVSFAGVLSSLL
ncbi:seven-hairpin glycosidase, partial [Exidia glandulosa HHB12029]